jgi:hypothetical protein
MSEIFKEVAESLGIDGLWTAEFGSSAGSFGGGVAVFRSGRILGGDGTHFYIGEYKVEGQVLRATLKVAPFISGAASIFRTVGQTLTLELHGSLLGNNQAVAQGRAREMPNLTFGVKLTKRS